MIYFRYRLINARLHKYYTYLEVFAYYQLVKVQKCTSSPREENTKIEDIENIGTDYERQHNKNSCRLLQLYSFVSVEICHGETNTSTPRMHLIHVIVSMFSFMSECSW